MGASRQAVEAQQGALALLRLQVQVALLEVDAAAAAVLSEPEQDTEIVLCPNCNEKMEEWNHVCEIKSDISESVDTE